MNTRHWRLLFLVLFVVLLASVSGAFSQSLSMGSLSLDYRGNLGLEAWYFPLESSDSEQPDWVGTLQSDLDVTLRSPWNLDFRANPAFYWDLESEDRRRVNLRELYLDWYKPHFELRSGWQTFSWKTVESYSPADFLNQTDQEIDLLDAPKLGEPAIRSRFLLGDALQSMLELYYLSYFTPARLPQHGNRYDFLAGSPITLETETSQFQYLSSKERWRPQGALRYKAMLGGLDFSVFYFNGYARYPELTPANPSNPLSPLTHRYHPVHKAGTFFQGAFGNWLWKGEGVYTQYEEKYTMTNFSNGKLITVDPYFSYTLGFEYTLYGIAFEAHDLGLLLEALGDSHPDASLSELDGFRAFRSHIFAGLRYVFNNTSDRSILLGGFANYRKPEFITQLKYEERLLKHFKANVELQAVYLESSSDLNALRHSGRATAGIVWYW